MSNGSKNGNGKEKPLLLISCLDWGLGHTTRSIPLIREFLLCGCKLIVACNSTQKKLLETEFPGITYAVLPGYDIRYSTSRWRTRLEIVFQVRKILTRIKAENHWLTAFLKENRVKGIVSDNRYGLYHPEIPSVFITHQLALETSGGRIANKISRKFIYKLIARFSECWIPDFEKKSSSLAGKLSHPAFFPAIPVKFIGALSRFNILEREVTNDVAIILSGPEPQRSLLEEIILKQAATSSKKIVLVRGLPGTNHSLQAPGNVLIHDHLPSHQLNELICSSEYVISRAGYTSIMDLSKLKKKFILIATPGQPEQEYLASWMAQQQYAVSIRQHNFSLEDAINTASVFPYQYADQDMDQYKQAVRSFVARISS